MDLILEIKAKYAHMNPAMKRIADTLLERTPDQNGYTIGMLAQKSSVSTATVTRFVHYLGFENYKSFHREMQNAYALRESEDARDGAEPPFLFAGGFPNQKDAKSVCHYVLESETEMLKDTLSLMDYELMERVAHIILNARQVLFVGEGYSYLAAQSACMRFRRLGVLCVAYADYHGMAAGVCMAKPDDLIVGISNMGASALVTECLERARKSGAKTIAITSVKESPVDKAAELTLLTGFNYGSFSSMDQSTCYEPGSENIPQYSIIDCLYLICVMNMDESFLERYQETKEMIEEKRW